MKIFGVVGWKNSGKTTLVAKLVAEIKSRGFQVSTVKHAHHSFDLDQPGRDSYKHRAAGASEVLISSRNRWALMHEIEDEAELTLAELLKKMTPVDLVIVEGFKSEDHQKIECHRPTSQTPLHCVNDPTVVAVASETAIDGGGRTVLDLNDTVQIADFVIKQTGLKK